MKRILLQSEVGVYARPVSNHVDTEKINAYIAEAEDMDVRPSLGDALYMDIASDKEKYELLLNGGSYESRCGLTKYFSGLRKAIAYYAFARTVKNIELNVTAFGLSYKEDDYSSRPSLKEKIMAYNDAFSVGDRYMKECVEYLNAKKDMYPLYKGVGNVAATRNKIRIIGE